MKKQAKLSMDGVKYILRIFLQLLFQVGVILATAGTFHVGARVLLYFIVLTGSYIASLWAITRHNPEVINERTKNYKVNTKSWDKVLLPLYVIGTFLVMNIFIIIIISIRTYLEDRMLKEELKGYREYAEKVKYRIVPYLW